MIKLKNIRRNKEIIECDIYPEGSSNAGKLVVNLSNREVESFTLPKDYEWCTLHISYAKNALLEMFDTDEWLEERLIMWC